MDLFKGILAVLQEYPLWVRVAAAGWVVLGALLIGAFVLVPRSPASSGRTTDSTTHARIPSVRSHYEAALARLLELDCTRHIVASTPNFFTPERTFCETLAELRQNLFHLAQARRVLLGQAAPVAVQPLRYDAIARFIRSSYTEQEYGPKKDKLMALVRDLTSKTLPTERSREVLAKWNVASDYTLDDLFIANGFLEWIVGYAARSLRPSEFYRLGPFCDEAFPPDERQHLVFRALKDYAARDSQYVEIVSAFD